MLKANKKSLARIKKIYAISKQVWPQSRMDCYQVNGAKNLIREYAKKAHYDPKKLDSLEKFFNKRIEWKKAEERKAVKSEKPKKARGSAAASKEKAEKPSKPKAAKPAKK